MDLGDLLVWGLIIAFYLLSSLGRLLRGKDKPEETAEARPPGVPPPGAPQPPPGAPSPRTRPEDALEEFLRRIGGDLEPQLEPPEPQPTPPMAEPPVLSEHRPTPGEHVRTLSEHRRRPGEHVQAPGERRQAPSELRQAPGEVLPTLGEHRPTIGERLAGDVKIGPRVLLPPVRSKRRGSPVRRRLVRDLGDRDSLAHAFLLREVLGPPVALRQGPPSDPQSR